MVDDIDREMTREELYQTIDNLREMLRRIRVGLKSDELPEPIILKEMGHYAKWPEDNERGKRLQRRVGSEKIPFKSECEGGAGLWLRLNSERTENEQ